MHRNDGKNTPFSNEAYNRMNKVNERNQQARLLLRNYRAGDINAGIGLADLYDDHDIFTGLEEQRGC